MQVRPIASGSTGNAYIVSDGKTTLLLDAGVAVKTIQKALKYRAHEVEGVFITHRHYDHARSAEDFVRFAIDVYGPQDTIESCGLMQNHRAHVLKNLQEIRIGTMAVKAFEVKHDVPCFGYMITVPEQNERLVYITDAQYCRYRFPHVTHWILEANFSEEQARQNVADGTITQGYKNRIWQTHMSIENTRKLLLANDTSYTKQIYLAHMSDKNAREQEFIRTIQEATGAEVYAC